MTARQLQEIIGHYKVRDEPFYIVYWSDSDSPTFQVTPGELKPFKEDLLKYWLQKVGLVDVDRHFKNAKEKMAKFEGVDASIAQVIEPLVELDDFSEVEKNEDNQNSVQVSQPMEFETSEDVTDELSNENENNPREGQVEQKVSKNTRRNYLNMKTNIHDKKRNFLLPCFICKLYFNERAFKDHFVKHDLSVNDEKSRCCHCGMETEDENELALHITNCKSSLRCDPDLLPACKRAKRGAPKKVQASKKNN